MQIHTKRRNRLSTEKLNSLVYIMYNMRLKHKYMKKKSLQADDDPLIEDELPSDDEWVAGESFVKKTFMEQPSGSRAPVQKRRRDQSKLIIINK